MYSSHTGAIKYNREENCIEWMWTAANLGFDIEPSFICMAVYNYSEEDNLDKEIPSDKVESVLNAIILIDHKLMTTNNDILFLSPYLASQIFRDNLSYKTIVEEKYPELKSAINHNLMSFLDKTIIPTTEINNLILASPYFLRNREIPVGIDINIIYDYLKNQIRDGKIKESDLLVLYAYMWKHITSEVE